MASIYYSIFNEITADAEITKLSPTLPLALQEKLARYHRFRDKWLYLIGKLLLIKGMENKGLPCDLNQLRYNKFDKPELKGLPNFNITHSGDLVMVAVADSGLVGIDVELIHPVNFEHFTDLFNEREWEIIKTSEGSYHEFFRFWTIKEAVLKADGCGLNEAAKNVSIAGNIAELNNHSWYIHQVDVDERYICHLVTENVPGKVELIPVKISAES